AGLALPRKLLGSKLQVFPDGQCGEDVLRLWHKGHAASQDLVRFLSRDVGTVELCSPAEARDDTRNSLDECGLASAIRAEDCNELALAQGKVDVLNDWEVALIAGDKTACSNDRRAHMGS